MTRTSAQDSSRDSRRQTPRLLRPWRVREGGPDRCLDPFRTLHFARPRRLQVAGASGPCRRALIYSFDFQNLAGASARTVRPFEQGREEAELSCRPRPGWTGWAGSAGPSHPPHGARGATVPVVRLTPRHLGRLPTRVPGARRSLNQDENLSARDRGGVPRPLARAQGLAKCWDRDSSRGLGEPSQTPHLRSWLGLRGRPRAALVRAVEGPRPR